jgi:hypothetical protein
MPILGVRPDQGKLSESTFFATAWRENAAQHESTSQMFETSNTCHQRTTYPHSHKVEEFQFSDSTEGGTWSAKTNVCRPHCN